jgi:DNA-binding MarR family transcriptional regulator
MSQQSPSQPDDQKSDDPLSVALFSEMFMADQLARNRLGKALPKGMELSHFSVLNQLARSNEEKTPAQLARIFHVTRGAMTNTLNRLEWAGHIHVRPDWDDARRKLVAISPAGRARATRPSPPSPRSCPTRSARSAPSACARPCRSSARCACGWKTTACLSVRPAWSRR